MKTFVQRGSQIYMMDPAEVQHLPTLPPANYIINVNHFGEYYLEKVEDFPPTGKVYGSGPKMADRIIRTYRDRPFNTGVLLTGEKGSGKTMLGRLISNLGQKLGIPTLMLGKDLAGDNFNNYLQSIEQECIIFFDEFDKTYEVVKQEELLTLLDGTFQSHKLFVFTMNNSWNRMTEYMLNRPGRIYYYLEFKTLETEFIKEYCKDNLKNKKNTESVLRVAKMFERFNFDMLKAIIEEMNRYDESALEVMEILNTRPSSTSDREEYEAEVKVNGRKIHTYDRHVYGSPLGGHHLTFTQYFPGKEKENVVHEFSLADMVNMNNTEGKFLFKKGTATLELKRKRAESFNLAFGYEKTK